MDKSRQSLNDKVIFFGTLILILSLQQVKCHIIKHVDSQEREVKSVGEYSRREC